MKGVEIEWQFEAAALPAVDNWLREHAAGFGFALTQAATHDQTDIYLDTDDWRCYRAGYALRLRRVTTAESIEASFKGLKRPADTEAGPLRRSGDFRESGRRRFGHVVPCARRGR